MKGWDYTIRTELQGAWRISSWGEEHCMLVFTGFEGLRADRLKNRFRTVQDMVWIQYGASLCILIYVRCNAEFRALLSDKADGASCSVDTL